MYKRGIILNSSDEASTLIPNAPTVNVNLGGMPTSPTRTTVMIGNIGPSRGNGSELIILMAQTTSIFSQELQAGVDIYTGANTNFTLASTFGDSKLVYRGTTTFKTYITITGLTRNRVYWLKAYEVNVANGLIKAMLPCVTEQFTTQN